MGSDRVFAWACFAGTWLALVATGASAQVYDAVVYVDSAQLIVDGTPPPDDYGFRGALTALIYLPTAVATKVGLSGDVGVLLQNSALLAALGSFLLPSLLAAAGARSRARTVACCVLVLVVLGRFAPPGLMDIWALAAALGAVLLLARPDRWRVAAAGALLGTAINLRPAYLIPTLVVLIAWAIWVRRHSLLLAVGSLAFLLPQMILELLRPGSLQQWWTGVLTVNEIQLAYSAWVVRYDTMPAAYPPQQFFCMPGMAAAQDGQIGSPVGLLSHLLASLPTSIDLMAQKTTAWLMWTWSTPYYDAAEPAISQLGVMVAILVVLGAYGWVQAARRGELSRSLIVVVAALALGVLAGVVTSTPEARFAMPLVVLGMVGVLLVRFDRMGWRSLGAVAAIVVVVVLLGRHGLSHPAPAGFVSPEICASPTTTKG
ncbi:hypothetical protein CXG46_19660 [Nocardioides alpinus]|uniref:Dolichyl-phosphate-mannose-protein mannosyltransferase n=1 Tax=Nocardioides alpinus TaxID=748909 RepID=A0ABX4QSK8_9ACTN|nr:hypothetical protein CXG46_19660 [Nocardioides alpinus]